MKSLYEQMIDTAANAGMELLSTDHAAQLMAVVYLYGDESAVYSDKMRADIQRTQKRFGLYGGGNVDTDFLRRVTQYARAVRLSGDAAWLREFEKRYGVELPEYRESLKAKGNNHG